MQDSGIGSSVLGSKLHRSFMTCQGRLANGAKDDELRGGLAARPDGLGER